MDPKTLNLEDLVSLFIVKFQQYSGKDQDKDTLSQDELCALAVKEFPTLCASQNKQDILNGIIGKMDANKDKKVDFEEFMCFSACVAIAIRGLCSK
ncbi:protein S100-A4-like [Pyxicephalus adspersus]|uniref:protein S100-A4-like n=1 Tax=Pyxicephalus adspersus TaxID=30357 RepID=UPI003B5A3DDF